MRYVWARVQCPGPLEGQTGFTEAYTRCICSMIKVGGGQVLEKCFRFESADQLHAIHIRVENALGVKQALMPSIS